MSKIPAKVTIKEALILGQEIYNIEPIESQIFLQNVLQNDNTFLFAHPELQLTKPEIKKFINYLERRKNSEPVAYIVNEKSFYKSTFYVDKRVLIPRLETEKIVEDVLSFLKKDRMGKNPSIVDACTGSGCIGISIIKEISNDPTLQKKCKKSVFYLTDISQKALNVCKRNAEKILNAEWRKKCIIKKTNLLDYFLKNKIQIDVLTINPPYIPTTDYRKLEKQIKEYEPRIALDSGKNYHTFLDKIRAIKKRPQFKETKIFAETKNGKIISF